MLATIRRMSILLPALAVLALPAAAQSPAEAAVGLVLDTFHEAASRADFETYFSLFAADAVFLGTDATERWDRGEFMAFTKPYFEQGHGWTYVPLERHITIGSDGVTAWFDERLQNDNLGECRGSGVLVWEDGAWKVAQYNLTIPVPNALAGEVVKRIREQADSIGS